MAEYNPLASIGSSVDKSVADNLSLITLNSQGTSPYKPPVIGSLFKPNTDYASERLYTIRPRYSAKTFTNNGIDHTTQDRGDIAYIQLLSTSNSVKDSERKLSTNLDAELGELKSSAGYKRFFLTDINVTYSEKVQITTTFGDNEVVYYFGRQPVVFNLSGVLFDSVGVDWFNSFISLYNEVIRGTQLAKNYELIKLVLPNMVLVGSILNLQHSQNSARDNEVGFSMQFLAKTFFPIPVSESVGTPDKHLTGDLVDFSVGKTGFDGWGAKLSVGNIGGGLIHTVESGLSGILGPGSYKALNTAAKVDSVLSNFRSSMFDPVYGILSTITKVVKSSSGDLTKIISSFTNPVNAILRDITSISYKAIALSNLIENSVNDVARIPARMINNFNTTLKTLKYASGVITRVPENISQILKRNYRSGRLKSGAAILKAGKNKNKSKAAVLSSGAPYSTKNAYRL